MRNKRWFKGMAVVMAAAMLTMSGCGAREEEPAAAPEAGGSAAEASGAGAAIGEAVDITQEPLKIGFAAAQMDTNPVYWVQGMESVLSGYPNIEFNIFDAGSKAETQVQQMTEMINQEYDAIIINVTDAAAVAAVTTQAEEAGINVIGINQAPDCIHSGDVLMESYTAGVLSAKYTMEKLPGGKCVAIGAPVALSTIVIGARGFEETLAGNSSFEFLEAQAGDWTTENANELMRNFLTKYNNDIQAVYCQSDQMAIGAAQAIEAAGLTGQILVFGGDGIPEAFEYIKEGKMTGTIYADAVQMGVSAMQLALYDIATGLDGSKLSTSPSVRTPLSLITADTVDDYM